MNAAPPLVAPERGSLRFDGARASLDLPPAGPGRGYQVALAEADGGRILARWNPPRTEGPLRLEFLADGAGLGLCVEGRELPGRADPGATGPLALELALAEADGARVGLPAFLPVLRHAGDVAALERRRAEALCLALRPGDPAPEALRGRKIFVLARNIFPRDAVGRFCLDVTGLFRAAGLDARAHAACFPPELAGVVRPLGLLPREAGPDDLAFCNHSIEDEFLPLALGLPCAKALYSHGVTPGEFFRPYDPPFAELLDRSRTQYPAFRAFDAALANSDRSLAEIAPYLRPGVAAAQCPPFLAPTGLETARPEPAPVPGRYLLWVGRLAPHKRPDFALALFRALGDLLPDCSLMFVGGGKDAHPAFGARLDALLAEPPQGLRGRVRLASDLSPAALRGLFEGAAALLCTSRHEGFCVPLYEAMRLGAPVFATREAGVEETLGGAGLLLPDDPEAAAQACARALESGPTLAALRRAGQARGRELAQAARGAAIWRTMRDALAATGRD